MSMLAEIPSAQLCGSCFSARRSYRLEKSCKWLR